MPNILLEQDAIQTSVVDFRAWEPPLLTYKDAFREAGVNIMPKQTERLLKLQTEIAIAAESNPGSFLARHPRFVLSLHTCQGVGIYIALVVGVAVLACLLASVSGHSGERPYVSLVVGMVGFTLYLLLSETHKAPGTRWTSNAFDIDKGTYLVVATALTPPHFETTPLQHQGAASLLDRQLRRVPGLKFHHVVQTCKWDPFGCVVITQIDGCIAYKVLPYIAWEGLRVTWFGGTSNF